MHLIVGLGNPGSRYSRNRHNIGFQIVEVLAARYALALDKRQHSARVAMGTIRSKRVLLAQPATFMNDSGRAVRQLMDYYKIPLEQLIVVLDDLDLPHAQLRLRPKGGSGGQRGMRSTIQHLGSEEFARLRVGIGRPSGRMDPAAYVLQDFSVEQEEQMIITRQEVADALEVWLEEGIENAMNRFN